ncbi:hypothetical protein F4815DRAFT_476574 [Daldinia loculata]|nr:hypothetical protein F4815DRAFT_476574 [Daldinia loculata]
MISGNVSSKLPDDFSGRYHISPDIRASTLPKQPPPWIQNHTALVIGPNTGLSALFQQPDRLRSHTESYPSRLQNRPSSSDSTNPYPQTFLSITPSTSCSSMVSEYSIHIRPSRSEFQMSQARASHDRPLPMSFQPESITKPTNSLSDETDRNPRLAHSLSYRIALSQVFMYQARMSDRPAKSTLAIPGDDVLLKYEGSRVQRPRTMETETKQVRRATTSLVTTTLDSPHLFQHTAAPNNYTTG